MNWTRATVRQAILSGTCCNLEVWSAIPAEIRSRSPDGGDADFAKLVEVGEEVDVVGDVQFSRRALPGHGATLKCLLWDACCIAKRDIWLG